MPEYTFRCPVHGDFQVEQPMKATTRNARCNRPLNGPAVGYCQQSAPKVLGAVIQFTYGKAAFHDGPDGTGETVRETGERWMREARAQGLNPEPVGSRWV